MYKNIFKLKMKYFFHFLIFSFVFLIFFISNVTAVCLDEPTRVKVNSGNIDIGFYDVGEIKSGKLIYIKDDLSNYPLDIELYFDGNDENCFNSTSDIKFKLFSSSLEVDATSISYQDNSSIVKFNFNVNFIAPATFSSNYIVKHIENAQGSIGSIFFGVDNNPAEFQNFIVTPNTNMLEEGSQIKIEYTIIDSGSGLDELVISGGSASSTINLNGSSTYSGVLQDNLSASTTYKFTINDMIGNKIIKEQSFLIDKTNPTISDFEIKEYSITNRNGRAVSFKVKIEDDSFSYENIAPIVVGDFSQIDSSKSSYPAVCNKLTDSNLSYYNCNFDNIIINQLNLTKSVSISITAKDNIGNQINGSFSTEIFYDGSGPKISDFYLENSLGTQNIFSAYDENVKVYLEFSDESLKDIADISIVENFDGDNFYISALRTCNFKNIQNDINSTNSSVENVSNSFDSTSDLLTSTTSSTSTSLVNSINNDAVTCIWDLKNYVSKYAGQEKGSVVFKITLMDTYGNIATQDINVSFDNGVPKITKIELIETESIKDDLINSGEIINFRVFVQDSNLDFAADKIYADFSNIDYNDGMDKKAASCASYGIDEDGKETFQCDFEGIAAENGYLKRDVNFVIIDKTANVVKENYEVEVLKIADEMRDVYKIVDLNDAYLGTQGTLFVLNPLNRAQAMRTENTVWFEGKLELINGADSDFELINYELIDCDRDGFMPIIVNSNELYPNKLVKRGENDSNAKFEFAMKVDLSAHPNKADLNDKQMKCTMAILKKDSDTIYGADIDNIEKIDFLAKIAFYDLPNEDLLEQYAQNILEDIDDAYIIGEWFNDVYEIYEYMSKGCSLISTLNTVLSTVDTAWTGISYILHGITVTKPGASAGDHALHPASDYVSSLTKGGGIGTVMSYVNSFCRFVTCDAAFNKKAEEIITFGLTDWINNKGEELGGGMCSAILDGAGGSDETPK